MTGISQPPYRKEIKMEKVQCDYCGKYVKASKTTTIMSKYDDEMITCQKCETRVFNARGQQAFYEQQNQS